jgi:hypothetical protein
LPIDRDGTWSVLRLVLVLTPIAVATALYLRSAGMPSVAPEPVRAAAPPLTAETAAPAPTPPAAVDPDLAEAAAKMVAPPLGTPLALLATDPRRLRALMQDGLAAYQGAATEAKKIEGIHRMQIAAVLGYGPARDLLAREYSRSRVVRSAVAAPDAIRYSLDVFTGDPVAAKNTSYAFRTLVLYYADQKALGLLATNIVEAIIDDRRLQLAKRLDPMFDSLVPVPGACAAAGRAINFARSVGPDCPPPLRAALVTYARTATPIGRDPSSRRQALAQVERLGNSN